ncbi:MAG TPA: glycosyltransferase family 4 protein [Dehalococcoidia bacterium]
MPIYAIIPCAEPITGGVYADLKIVEQLRARGWTVEPIFFGTDDGVASRYRPWDQLKFNFRLMRRLHHAPSGFILLEDQALSSAVGLANCYARRFRGARIGLVTYHLVFNVWRNPVRRYLRRLVEGAVARSADIVLASSESTRSELLRLGVREARLTVLRLGLRSVGTDKRPARSKRSDDCARLLTVGTVEPRKGLRYLLQALGQLSGCRWKLDIVGGFDPEHRAYLTDLAGSLGIAKDVHFRGRVSDDDLARFMKDADVYVSPSLAEGFGLAVLEAMSTGLPVIVAASGALPELVDHERTGLIVPPADAPAMADAVRRLLDDRSLRSKLGLAAAKAVNGQYTWEETGNQVEAALVRLSTDLPRGT